MDACQSADTVGKRRRKASRSSSIARRTCGAARPFERPEHERQAGSRPARPSGIVVRAVGRQPRLDAGSSRPAGHGRVTANRVVRSSVATVASIVAGTAGRGLVDPQPRPRPEPPAVDDRHRRDPRGDQPSPASARHRSSVSKTSAAGRSMSGSGPRGGSPSADGLARSTGRSRYDGPRPSPSDGVPYLRIRSPHDTVVFGRVQPLGHRLERPLAELDRQPRVRLEVASPGRLRVRGGDEDRAVGILDEADVDEPEARRSARPTVVSRATTPRRARAESSGSVSGSAVDGDRRRRSRRQGTPRSPAAPS